MIPHRLLPLREKVAEGRMGGGPRAPAQPLNPSPSSATSLALLAPLPSPLRGEGAMGHNGAR